MDTSLFLDINRFAEATTWLHGIARVYGEFGGLVVLALVIGLAMWRAMRDAPITGWRPAEATCWALGAAAIAYGLAQPLSHLIGRPRPFVGLRGVEVLVAWTHDFGCPSGQAVIAGAVIGGIALSQDRLALVLAAVAGVALAATRVYVGGNYPGDVLAGLGFGVVIVLGLCPLAFGLADRALQPVARHHGGAAPSERSEPTSAPVRSGITLLSDQPLVPQQPLRAARTGAGPGGASGTE